MTENAMFKYAQKFSGDSEEILEEVVNMTQSNLEYDDMLSGPVVAGLLRFLINVSESRRVLEIGMFTGYATLSMAFALPEDGKVITCESNLRYINLARPLFRKSGVQHKIDIQQGEAIHTLDKLDPYFDLIFIDADKENYMFYYEKCLPLLKSDGILVVDNAWLTGKVLDSEDPKGKVVHKLNIAMQSSKDLMNVLLPVRDGIHIAIKR